MTKLNDNLIKILSKQSFAPKTFSDMKEICDRQTTKWGVVAFEYARVYDDGTAMMLYSDPNIANYVINKELHITAHVPKEIIDTKFWFIPDPNGPYSSAIQDIKDISGVNSAANYIQRHIGFYELYSFWRKEDQILAANQFINIKESLEQFCLQFVECAQNLIVGVDKDRFKLTDQMLPNFKGLDVGFDKFATGVNLNFYLEKTHQELIKLNSHILPRLSTQELKCIRLLFEGKTATDMANLLNLSHRTIEMHLNSAKLKLNCNKKSEIISTLIDLAEAIEK